MPFVGSFRWLVVAFSTSQVREQIDAWGILGLPVVASQLSSASEVYRQT